jgi:F-type H+-transporting ATPase subunit gamma
MSQVDIKYAREIAQYVIEYYTDHDLDAVYLVYNEFKSVVQQNVVVEPLLPIGRLEVSGEDQNELDYIYEQNPQILFDHLLSRHVEIQLFRALLESEAAEHGARMTAMDSATKNAKEVIDKLTLHMNRIRQASITTELIEVVSGADALGK